MTPSQSAGDDLKRRLHELENRLAQQERDLAFLREDAERYRLLVQSVGEGIGIVDAEEHFLFANPAAERIFGVSDGALIGKSLQQFITPEQWSIIESQTGLRGQGMQSSYEVDITTPAGIKRRLHLTASPRFDSNGRYSGSFGIFRDFTQYRNLEKELQIFHLAVHHATDAIGMSTPEGQHYYQNTAMTKLFGGRSAEEVSGAVCPPSAIYADEATGREIFRTVKSGGTWIGEVKMIGRHGRMLDIFLRAYSIKDENDRVICMVGVHSDITERKRSEAALRDNETRFRTIFDNMKGGVAVYRPIDGDEDFEIIDMNEAGLRICQVSSKSDIIGRRVTDVFPGIRQMGLLETFQKVWRTARPMNHPVAFYQDERMELWLENYVNRIDPGYICVVFENITAQTQSQQALKRSEEQYRALAENSTDIISRFDVQHRHLYVNRAVSSLMNLPPSSYNGKTHQELGFPAELCTQWEHAIDKVFERRKEHHFSFELKDRYYDVRLNPVSVSGAQVDSVQSTTRDVTSLKLLEAEQQRAARLESVGILAGGIAHDFNNILTAVMGNVSLAKMMLQGQKKFPKLIDTLHNAERACVRARDLTLQLLTFSKGGSPVRKPEQLSNIIRETAEFSLRGSFVALELKFPDERLTANIDAGQISQVINNLVINAVQAMPGIEGYAGRIIISTEAAAVKEGESDLLKPGRYIRIVIEDNGRGIPRKDLPHIFDLYFSTKEHGSGLGLATSYSIIKNHDGYMTVDSRVGTGTKFTLYLPATDDTPAASRVAAKSVPRMPARILVMDDEEDVRSIVARILNHLGHTASTVADGREALAAYRQATEEGAPYHLVIMDLTVSGGMGGLQAVKLLKAEFPDAKVIVSSGYSSEDAFTNPQAFGFCASIPKPYSINELLSVLDAQLGAG